MAEPVAERVYIETTIPSFYYSGRSDPESRARQIWTRRWWRDERERYAPVASVAVLDELSRSSRAALREQRLGLVDSLPLVPVTAEVIRTARVYVGRRVMPHDVGGDALHLALASHHRCGFLLTWNCKHLANANKVGHIEQVNTELGLHVPRLVTPLELVSEQPDE